MGNAKSKEEKINKDLFHFIKLVRNNPDFCPFELYQSNVKTILNLIL